MGFPDDFVFSGSKTEIAKQIGNAVPPELAGAVARVIREALNLAAKSVKSTTTRTETTIGAASTAT